VDSNRWIKARQYSDDQLALAKVVLNEIRAGEDVTTAVRRYPLPAGGYLAKHTLVTAYYDSVRRGELIADSSLLSRIRMKPVRTLSGVTTVTVLTKPYPCPGRCIFCPDEIRMPKSYISDEPGARRALEHDFDPFAQVNARLEALEAVGHPTDKVELLILGGTWTSYPKEYQEWFIKRCFDALNEKEADSLDQAFHWNEAGKHRNVGLVIETRPDHIDQKELSWLRRLNVTKIQMGAQSLDDNILRINQRGHTVDQTRQAVALMRAAGIKIVLHWMPNLLGASLESDRLDFARLWVDICPDEIKIYPTQLLENTELHKLWMEGSYLPYTTEELIDLIADIKTQIPPYCRVNRIIRDIPSNYVVEGNRRTSLRQDVLNEMKRRGTQCRCIRCREVRDQKVKLEELSESDYVYSVAGSEEYFLSYVTFENRLAGFLRLTLPGRDSPQTGMIDLDNAAIIREVHVYGQSIEVGEQISGAAQHIGLGTNLLQRAEALAFERGYRKLAVISAIGTRGYYSQRGFESGELYQIKHLV
jgi:elongator complex protein 3